MTDAELEPFVRFLDRHRAQFGFRVREHPNHLLVDPNGLPMWAITAWIVSLHGVIIGVMVYLELWRDDPPHYVVMLSVMGFECPALLAIFYGMSRAESAKGPLLEVDAKKRVAVLPRNSMTIPFDGIEVVVLLIGWYRWTSEGRERVAEMSLAVRRADGRLVHIPVVLHNEVAPVKGLAERVARLTGRPLVPVERDRRCG